MRWFVGSLAFVVGFVSISNAEPLASAERYAELIHEDAPAEHWSFGESDGTEIAAFLSCGETLLGHLEGTGSLGNPGRLPDDVPLLELDQGIVEPRDRRQRRRQLVVLELTPHDGRSLGDPPGPLIQPVESGDEEG